jgi:hypothetical protein
MFEYSKAADELKNGHLESLHTAWHSSHYVSIHNSHADLMSPYCWYWLTFSAQLTVMSNWLSFISLLAPLRSLHYQSQSMIIRYYLSFILIYVQLHNGMSMYTGRIRCGPRYDIGDEVWLHCKNIEDIPGGRGKRRVGSCESCIRSKWQAQYWSATLRDVVPLKSFKVQMELSTSEGVVSPPPLFLELVARCCVHNIILLVLLLYCHILRSFGCDIKRSMYLSIQAQCVNWSKSYKSIWQLT